MTQTRSLPRVYTNDSRKFARMTARSFRKRSLNERLNRLRRRGLLPAGVDEEGMIPADAHLLEMLFERMLRVARSNYFDIEPEGLEIRFYPGDRYETIRQLGSGSTGKVSLVRDLADGHMYALKQIEWGTHDCLHITTCFLRREMVTSRVSQGRGVVRIHDMFSNGTDAYFLLMDYVDAKTLTNSHLSKVTLTDRVHLFWNIAHQLFDTLANVHASGVVHRDVKPANILLDFNNNVTLVDFGLACVMRGSCMRCEDDVYDDTTYPFWSPLQNAKNNGLLNTNNSISVTEHMCADVYAATLSLLVFLVGEQARYSSENESMLYARLIANYINNASRETRQQVVEFEASYFHPLQWLHDWPEIVKFLETGLGIGGKCTPLALDMKSFALRHL